jgi:hypothetical protein
VRDVTESEVKREARAARAAFLPVRGDNDNVRGVVVVENIEQIKIEHDEDIIFMTLKLYKFFMAKKKEGGLDAMVLYNHFMFTSRLQGETSIKANDTYIQHGLGWGIRKVHKAKAFLKKYGIIDYKAGKNNKGKFSEWYIVLKTSSSNPVPVVQKTTIVDNHPDGFEQQIPDINNKIPDKRNRNAGFIKPTLPEVVFYMREKGGTEKDGNRFFTYYESVNWYVGKKRMVNWKAAAAGWLLREKRWEGKEEISYDEYRRKHGI